MPVISRMVITALLLGGAGALPAQHAGTTTAPAVDLSTPRATLRTLNQAMREGDVDAIKKIFLAETPAETQMIDADAQMAAALAELRNAAVKAFGPENAKTLTGDTAAGTADSLARIDGADININGNTATVHYSGDKAPPFVLKKVDGDWKIVVSQLGKPLNPAELEQRISDLAIQRRVVLDIAAQIRSGNFASSEKAREAWQSRILQAATSQNAKP